MSRDVDNKLQCLLQRLKSFHIVYVQIFAPLKSGIRPIKERAVNPKNEFQPPRQDFLNHNKQR